MIRENSSRNDNAAKAPQFSCPLPFGEMEKFLRKAQDVSNFRE